MEEKLKEFERSVEFEEHILSDLEGTDLPVEAQYHLSELFEYFEKDKDNLREALLSLGERHLARGYIQFRRYLENFPLKNMKKLYNYCKSNQILSAKQLKNFKASIDATQREGVELEKELLERSLETGRKSVLDSEHTILIEEKAVKKAFSLTEEYQLKRGVECAGVFKSEYELQESYFKDFRGLNMEEASYKDLKVNYSESFRNKLEDVQENRFRLMHSHPRIGSEMGFIAYRPSEGDLTFFRNHSSQFSIICPLLPDNFDQSMSMAAIALTDKKFDFLPIRVVNSNEDVTDSYPQIQLYNKLLYLMVTADLDDQSKDQAMGSLQYMLGEEVLKELC